MALFGLLLLLRRRLLLEERLLVGTRACLRMDHANMALERHGHTTLLLLGRLVGANEAIHECDLAGTVAPPGGLDCYGEPSKAASCWLSERTLGR